jgi:hypothetical protein
MPKFYCEYCGIYLTHSSPSGRKQHAEGRKHIQAKIDYYSQLLVEAHQDGQLDKINNLFTKKQTQQEQMIRNPFDNSQLSKFRSN